jgi:hypothetical protein
MRSLCCPCLIFLITLQTGQGLAVSSERMPRGLSGTTQEREEPSRRPANRQTISTATEELQRAVNGNAFVRNRCSISGKEIKVEESSEIVQTDRCKLIVRTKKTTLGMNHQTSLSPDPQQSIEFMIYVDLSDLTTPVLVETQDFAHCEGGVGVLKVSSRSNPQHSIEVIRRPQRTPPAKPEKGAKQTRRDLSLFFVDPKAAKKAAVALDRAVKACGGQEWPDEDDLP